MGKHNSRMTIKHVAIAEGMADIIEQEYKNVEVVHVAENKYFVQLLLENTRTNTAFEITIVAGEALDVIEVSIGKFNRFNIFETLKEKQYNIVEDIERIILNDIKGEKKEMIITNENTHVLHTYSDKDLNMMKEAGENGLYNRMKEVNESALQGKGVKQALEALYAEINTKAKEAGFEGVGIELHGEYDATTASMLLSNAVNEIKNMLRVTFNGFDNVKHYLDMNDINVTRYNEYMNKDLLQTIKELRHVAGELEAGRANNKDVLRAFIAVSKQAHKDVEGYTMTHCVAGVEDGECIARHISREFYRIYKALA